MSERTVSIQLKSKAPVPDADARAWVRYPCDSTIPFQPLESRKGGTWRAAKVLNVSANGMCLVLDAPVQRGAMLCVLLEGAAQRFSKPVLVRVVRATEPPGDDQCIGCTFAIPLVEEELLALLPPDTFVSAVPMQPQQSTEAQAHALRAEHSDDRFLQRGVNERRNSPRRHIRVPGTIVYGFTW